MSKLVAEIFPTQHRQLGNNYFTSQILHSTNKNLDNYEDLFKKRWNNHLN